MSVSSETTSDAVKSRVRREEQRQLKPLPKKIESRSSDDNARFMEEETQRQQVRLGLAFGRAGAERGKLTRSVGNGSKSFASRTRVWTASATRWRT